MLDHAYRSEAADLSPPAKPFISGRIARESICALARRARPLPLPTRLFHHSTMTLRCFQNVGVEGAVGPVSESVVHLAGHATSRLSRLS